MGQPENLLALTEGSPSRAACRRAHAAAPISDIQEEAWLGNGLKQYVTFHASSQLHVFKTGKAHLSVEVAARTPSTWLQHAYAQGSVVDPALQPIAAGALAQPPWPDQTPAEPRAEARPQLVELGPQAKLAHPRAQPRSSPESTQRPPVEVCSSSTCLW